MITISKGLNLPIAGIPKQFCYEVKIPKNVAILGDDYIGMKPTMMVKVGDRVKKGQLLFLDKKTAGVKHTSPACGEVIEINRGVRRSFLSVVIRVDGDESISFDSFSEKEIESIEKNKVVETLVDSGLWTAFRTRPYSKTPSPRSTPHSIFVTAIDTNPLAPHPKIFIHENLNIFRIGLKVISKLTNGNVFLCKGPNTNIPIHGLDSVVSQVFCGPHPSGNVGTHIHYLDPVSNKKVVWNIGYQDVISIGNLFHFGELNFERMISIAGPQVKSPRLIKTFIGADLEDLLDQELFDGESRAISGSVLSGRTSGPSISYLGRFHNQVTVLKEGRERRFLGWLSPGFNLFSIKNVSISKLFPNKKFDFTTTTNGGKRSMVPIGMYEKVMPLDIQPTFLLRSLLSGDTDMAQKLGCLELDEEDLALCTYVCPSKLDYGNALRENLTKIERDG